MAIVHAKSFEFGFCFADWIVGSEVGSKFLGKQSEVGSPGRFVGIQYRGFETI